jgi:glycerol-1-phosphate dehydrogenase [NAD(P)+]
MLVCDRNTYSVLGKQVQKTLLEQDWEVSCAILEGEEVIADEDYLIQVLLRADDQPRLYVAVGSGTITDITRFCSHRTGNPFVSLPTAPSVDGFASVIAPVVIRRFKDTAYAHAPVAIFANIDTLCASPPAMIAAGFGDMLGKYTALADWQIAHLLTGEVYRPEIAERMRGALKICVENIQGIRGVTPQGITRLMDGLVESGICMQLNGNSRPASGAEHHLAHYWEMKLLRQGRPAILHGAKVGVGTVLIAERYERLRALSHTEVEQRLQQAYLPGWEQDEAEIQRGFGAIAARIAEEQRRYREMTLADFISLKSNISHHWEEIRNIAENIPSAQRIVDLLEELEAPSTVMDIGLLPEDETDALRYAQYSRSQFTITRLGNILGLW